MSRVNGDLLKRKAGAAGDRRPAGRGAVPAFSAVNYFFLIGQMIVPGSTYWNFGYGSDPGEVEKDEEGIKTMKDLGVNMAWLLKRLTELVYSLKDLGSKAMSFPDTARPVGSGYPVDLDFFWIPDTHASRLGNNR